MALKRHLFATTVMVVGVLSILVGIVSLNKAPTNVPTKPSESKAIEIGLSSPKPKKPHSPRRKTETKAKKAPSNTPPTPSLPTHLGAVGLRLSSFEGQMAPTQDVLGSRNVSNMVMSESAVDTAPTPSSRVVPNYPPRARSQGLSGFVKFSLLIDDNGNVSKAKVIESDPEGVFDSAASAAISQWKFSPALYRGKPVKVWATQTVRFSLGE